MDARFHQCHRDGCDSQAAHGVMLRLRCMAPGGIGHDLTFKCTIKVCDRHKDTVRDFVLSEINREMLRTQLMDHGYPDPDFLSARIEFTPIVDAIAADLALPTVTGCDRAKCANPAKWKIKLLFRHLAQNGHGKPAGSVLTNLCVCDKHRKDTKAADVLGDAADRDKLCADLRADGLLLPDMESVMIEFVALPAIPPAP